MSEKELLRRKKIKDLLRPLGIIRQGKKLPLLTECLLLILEEEDLLDHLQALYERASKPCQCSADSMESTIRECADLAWKTNPRLVLELAGYPLEIAPKNAQFLEMLYNHLSRQEAADALTTSKG